MVVPVILVLVSIALTYFGERLGLDDVALLAWPSLLAAILLLALAVRRRKVQALHYVVVDGSNVMHWQDNQASLASLRAVLDHLVALGYTPGVVFDANAGYKISARYQAESSLARLLKLPTDRVLVAPKGTPADPLILASARHLGARIVTNDRFRDWAGDYPEVEAEGHLIRGGFRDGHLWLEIDAVQKG